MADNIKKLAQKSVDVGYSIFGSESSHEKKRKRLAAESRAAQKKAEPVMPDDETLQLSKRRQFARKMASASGSRASTILSQGDRLGP